jgi:virulence-associated protein VagC
MNTAKIITDGANQVVILPQGFRLSGSEVYIKKVGNTIANTSSRFMACFPKLIQY